MLQGVTRSSPRDHTRSERLKNAQNEADVASVGKITREAKQAAHEAKLAAEQENRALKRQGLEQGRRNAEVDIELAELGILCAEAQQRKAVKELEEKRANEVAQRLLNKL